MEFSGQYLTYEEYKSLGGTLDIMPFNLLEFEARKQVDIRTKNRLKNQQIPDDVKLCIYHLINKINGYVKTTDNTSNVASESIEGYSVSFITANQLQEIVKSKNAELNDIIRTYLAKVIVNDEHILFAGVDR